MPNALLVYPEFPPSYWGGKFALDFVGKKSNMPPLGLLTVAGMFPKHYRLKVVDMNVSPLTSADLSWADVVFTSTMIVQKDSLQQVIEACNRAQVPIVVGGPHPTSFHEDIEGVDHFILDEVENIFPEFLRDLEQGIAKGRYRASERPDLTRTPLPRFDLVALSDYRSMALQFSRGCPFDCEFCDITKLFGRRSRTKRDEQVLAEFDLLYRLGWRGEIFLVDDNFIGNKRDAMRLLPAVAEWQRAREFPFSLYTEASVNLARLESLMEAMIEAGFDSVFLGIESPNPKALLKTKKKQNIQKGDDDYLIDAVRQIQHKGLEVMGGFILGLDGDQENVFNAQIQFIQKAGIPVAMVGLLGALKGTDLYHRLQGEGRLIEESTGDNVSVTLNFETEMDREVLIEGYKRVLSTIYDPTLSNYFERCLTMLKHLKPTHTYVREVGRTELVAVARSIRRQLFSRQGPAYLRFLTTVLRDHPGRVPDAMRLAIAGYHFEKVTSQQIAVHNFTEYLNAELEAFKERVTAATRISRDGMDEVRVYGEDLFARVHSRYEEIHKDFRYGVEDALAGFQEAVEFHLDRLSEPTPLGLN